MLLAMALLILLTAPYPLRGFSGPIEPNAIMIALVLESVEGAAECRIHILVLVIIASAAQRHAYR